MAIKISFLLREYFSELKMDFEILILILRIIRKFFQRHRSIVKYIFTGKEFQVLLINLLKDE